MGKLTPKVMVEIMIEYTSDIALFIGPGKCRPLKAWMEQTNCGNIRDAIKTV